MRALSIPVVSLLIVGLGTMPLARGQQAGGAFEDLVRLVPDEANAIVLIDVDKAVSSPYGKKNNWSDKIESAFTSGLTVVSPGAKQSVIAVQFDLEEAHPLWEVAIMRLAHEPDVEAAARLYMGDVDKIGKYPAIDLPGGAYAVKFGTNIAAAMAPANRQSASRWVREVDAHKGPALSPYLTEAYKFANDLGTPMIIALDLEDVPSVDEVREALSSHEALKGVEVDVEKLASALASIRGVTLGVTLAAQPFGKLKVDFRENVPLTPELAKTLLLAALEKRGAMLVELEDWKPAVKGKEVTLEGH
jgi:hypothetical protein